MFLCRTRYLRTFQLLIECRDGIIRGKSLNGEYGKVVVVS